MGRTPPPSERLGRNCRHATEISQAPVDRAIAALAAKQNGNVTRQQLLDLGLDDASVRRRLKAGHLHRVHRGVYAVGRRPVTPHERASAAVLACGPGAALSHGSAMTLWGFWRRWDQPFEVTIVGDRRTKGIALHRSTTLAWREVRSQLGIRVTSPARTLLDIGPRLADKSLTRTVRNALHSGWLTESQLAEVLARHAHLAAARRIAPLLGLPGTPPRAGWEDDFPAFCERQGLPMPVMGATVCGYIVDALFVDENVIVELDSWDFHKDAIAFQTDRERDAETLARGFVTVRITWERIHEAPDREGARLRRILAQRRMAGRA